MLFVGGSLLIPDVMSAFFKQSAFPYQLLLYHKTPVGVGGGGERISPALVSQGSATHSLHPVGLLGEFNEMMQLEHFADSPIVGQDSTHALYQ